MRSLRWLDPVHSKQQEAGRRAGSTNLGSLHHLRQDDEQHAQRGCPAALRCLTGVPALQIPCKSDQHDARLQQWAA